MIQTEQGEDRGVALFKKYSKAITAHCLDQKNGYFQSRVYQGLRNRVKLNDEMVDNVFRNTQSYISDLAPPIIRKAYHEFTALFAKFLEQDPLFQNDKATDAQRRCQELVEYNLKNTNYRDDCLTWSIDQGIRYGTYGVYSFATDDYNAGSLLTIKDSADVYGNFKQVYNQGELAVISVPIHPMNCIVDPKSNYMVKPDFLGFIGDIQVSSLIMLKDNPNYISENLGEVIGLAKKGLPDKDWFGGTGYTEAKNYSKGHCSIVYMWTKLPFSGNEGDPNWYYVEFVADKIIRIEQHNLDKSVIPFTTGVVIPRPYSWVGNSPIESKIAIQNMMNWLINTEFETTAKLMDRIVLYREGSLDIAALNSRHKTGGWVPYKGQEQDLSRLIHTPMIQDVSRQNLEYLVRELRQEDQETSPIVNMQNKYNMGGMNNSTLGAAQMQAGIGEMLTASMINNFVQAQKKIALSHSCLFAAAMTEEITLDSGTVVTKEDFIENEHKFYVKTSNVYNYVRDLQDETNRITQVINWKATQIPEMQGFKLDKLAERWARASLRRESVNDVYEFTQQPPQMQQGGMPPAGPGQVPPPMQGPSQPTGPQPQEGLL